jgi:hypothetical protein
MQPNVTWAKFRTKKRDSVPECKFIVCFSPSLSHPLLANRVIFGYEAGVLQYIFVIEAELCHAQVSVTVAVLPSGS